MRTLLLLVFLLIVMTGRVFADYRESSEITDSTRPYYLFCYFLQENQGMCYAISRDGLHWQPLNNSKPYLVPKIGTNNLMRDPSINIGRDGVYRVVWTTGWTGDNIGYDESKDLIHWGREQLLPVMKNVKGTKHCWAPEIFYDDLNEQYIVFWSSAVDSLWSIYYAPTKKFKHFGPTKILFANGGSGGGKNGDEGPIDPFLFKGTDRYVLFYKKDNNTGVPDLFYRFGRTPEGPWQKEMPIVPSTGDEGPSCIKEGREFRVYTDPIESPNAYEYVSIDLKTWKQYHTDLKMSHGTVLKISKKTALKLIEQSAKNSTRH